MVPLAAVCVRALPLLLASASVRHHSMNSAASQREVVTFYEDIRVDAPAPGPPVQQITVTDLMPYLSEAIRRTGIRDGTVTLLSKHTTTSITINEWESRLTSDLCQWLLALAPPDDRSAIGGTNGIRYLHNDIDQRPDSDDERRRCVENGWDVDDPVDLQRWRDQF